MTSSSAWDVRVTTIVAQERAWQTHTRHGATLPVCALSTPLQTQKHTNAHTHKQIWELASGGGPFLNINQFTTALRLVALAQVCLCGERAAAAAASCSAAAVLLCVRVRVRLEQH